MTYDFSIRAVFKEAWSKVSGFKIIAWKAIAIWMAISLLLLLLNGILMEFDHSTLLKIVLGLIRLGLTYPLMIAIAVMGAKRAANLPVNARMVFDFFHWNAILRLFGLLICFWITTLGCFFISLYLLSLEPALFVWRFFDAISGLAFMFLGIYLLYAYAFAFMLCAEKKLGAWQALELSRKTVTQHWFKLFFTMLLTSIVMIISAIPLLIGLIWAAPWMYCTYGVLYRTLFGLEPMKNSG